MLSFKKCNYDYSRECYDGEFKVLKPEGVDELNVLCPKSNLTGFPISMQQAVFMITDKNSRLADVLFQEIPAIRASDQLNDTDKFKMLVSRLDTGSFAENDNVAEILGNIAKEFFPSAEVDKVVKDKTEKIDFKPADAPAAEA